ncbi:MAG: T9SS type A sorting domain-containing protein [Bacteroidales bacterium]|nr:T9SS type A sorting domain-containing protein [Bacteroidales bacterium]
MKKNKVIFLLSAFIFFSMIAQSQTYVAISIEQPSELIADAGADVEITTAGNVIIGGNPTASGGTTDYLYSWSPYESLDDNTLANPTASITETTTYSVLVTDDNGCSENDEIIVTLAVVSVNDLVSGVSCSIFPNPSMNYISLELISENVCEKLSIKIVNNTGQIIMSENVNFEHKLNKQFDISNYTKGLYFISIQGEKTNINKSFIIN